MSSQKATGEEGAAADAEVTVEATVEAEGAGDAASGARGAAQKPQLAKCTRSAQSLRARKRTRTCIARPSECSRHPGSRSRRLRTWN